MKVRLLLTATIRPCEAMPYLARRDEQSRMKDYRAALTAWLSSDSPPITFCENSGADLSELKSIELTKGKGVEFIQFSADPCNAQRGKGYGEMEIIKTAFERSASLRSSEMVIKVSGRQFVSNLGSWIEQLSGEPDVAVCCDFLDFLSATDSRVFAGTPHFFEQFLFPRLEVIDDRQQNSFEHALARAIHQSMADGLKWVMPKELPQIIGTCASSGETPKCQWNAIARRIASEKHAIKRRMFRAREH